MDLRAELLTEQAQDAVDDVLGSGTLFAESLPLHLWPHYDENSVFSEWTRARQQVSDENARPIWDGTAQSLRGSDGYATVARTLTDLERFFERVEVRARPEEAAFVQLEYATEALRIENTWGAEGAGVGAWLDGDGRGRERPWWKWIAVDGGRGLYIPELYPILGEGEPARVVAAELTWTEALSRAKEEFEEARLRRAPFAELGDALRFQIAVVRTALTRHVVRGDAGPFPAAVALAPDEAGDPFPPGFPGAEDTPLEDKVAFVMCAHEAIGAERTFSTGKSELLDHTTSRLRWSRERARHVGIAIGAYRPSRRGRPIHGQQELDLNQFVDAIRDLWPRVQGLTI